MDHNDFCKNNWLLYGTDCICSHADKAFNDGKEAYETKGAASCWENPFFSTRPEDDNFRPGESELGKAWAKGWGMAQMTASIKKFARLGLTREELKFGEKNV